jgi:hypothetical protein
MAWNDSCAVVNQMEQARRNYETITAHFNNPKLEIPE